ncbi:hypothetical protein [Alkalimarinus coralli]|uniref:hypothetical protein n=1 Tax=Alkalimarinus coralli TaxID=2935863 RepID=UPI00202B9675|nr:hypothetical protein [Alkalimarinus coralli]
MKRFALLLSIVPFAYANNLPESADQEGDAQEQAVRADAGYERTSYGLQQAKEYCQSMLQDGTPDSDANDFVDQCVSEQMAYVDTDEDYEISEPDCYQQIDNIVQDKLENDPDSSYDYDQLLNNCLNGSSAN